MRALGRVVIALFAGFFASPVFGQSATELPSTAQTEPVAAGVSTQAPSTEADSTPEQAAADSEAPQEASSPGPEYVSALDGSGLIALDSMRRFHPLFGGTVSGGWDSNPGVSSAGGSSALYTVSPYMGLQGGGSRSQFIFQYQPTYTYYGSFGGSTMHQASAKAMGSLSPRLSWTLGVTGSHGEDAVRLLAPTESVAVGGVAATGPGSASYLPNAGTITNLIGGFGFHYAQSARDNFDFDLSNSYSSTQSLNESYSVGTANLTYTHGITPTLALVEYAQVSEYYIGLHCTSIGGGGGVRWQPRAGMLVAVKGGPQIDTPGCNSQQGVAYSAEFATRVTGRSQLYVLSQRQAVVGYLGPGVWQDGISGGYSRSIGTKDSIAFDLGFTTSSSLKSIGPYRGTYSDASYSHTLNHELAAVCSFRNFSGSLNGASSSRNVVLVSLTWTPGGRQLAR